MSMFFAALFATATMTGSAEEINLNELDSQEDVVVYEDAELIKLKELQDLVEDTSSIQEISMSDLDTDPFEAEDDDE